MGFSRWCSVESKCFELVVEGAATELKILESSRGVTRSIRLNSKDSSWLLASVEELIAAKDSVVFWRRSRSGFPSTLVQRCANKHGRFLIVEDFGGDRHRGSILVLEGKNGEGWESFRTEHSAVVIHMKAFKGFVKPPVKMSHVPMKFEPPRTVLPPEPPRRRSFVETMMSPANGGEPLLQMFTKQNKWPEMKPPSTSAVMRPVAPKPPAPMNRAVMSAAVASPNFGAVKSTKEMMSFPDISPAACFLEERQKISLRDTLERIKGDVTHCLLWLDSGFFAGGLMDSTPKPASEAPIKKN